MALLLLFVTVLLLWGSRPAEGGTPLGKEETRMLKGAFALLVFCHHIYQHLTLWQPFRVLADVGFLWVGGFFFLSGYGLMKSLQEKENYLKGYFGKRLPAIFVPFFLVNAVELVLRMGVGERMSAKDALGSFILFPMLDSNHWFLVAIFLFYIAFYFAYRFFPRWVGNVLILLAVTAYMLLFSHLTRGQTWWYNAVYAFPAGILWAQRKKTVYRLANILSLVVFLIAFSLEYGMGLDRQKTFFFMIDHMSAIASTRTVENLIFLFQSIAAVAICIYLVTSLSMWRPGNRLLAFFGDISYEFYLIHGCVIFVLKSQTIDMRWDTGFAVGALILSTLAATGLHALSLAIFNLFKKEKKYVSAE